LQSEKCPHCQQDFAPASRRQKFCSRTQNDWCFKNRQVLKVVASYKRKHPPKTRTNVIKIREVQHPLTWAMRQARKNGHRFIVAKFHEDAQQEVAVALLETGIRDFESPHVIDVKSLDRAIQGRMYSLARSLGFRLNSTTDSYTSVLDVMPAVYRPLRAWQTEWMAS